RYRATASSESGRREADLIGRSVFDLIDQAMREPVRAHLAAAVSGAQRQFETTYLAAPGADPQQFSVVLARVPGDGGGGGGPVGPGAGPGGIAAGRHIPGDPRTGAQRQQAER